MNAIECAHLSRRYGRTVAVDDVSLAVPQGSIFALLGPNGAGKSTTLKMLLNLTRPTSGSARVLGCDSTRLGKEQFRSIGYVSEDQVYPEWMTVEQLVAYYRPFYPGWDAALEARLSALFALPAGRRLRELSRGSRVKAILLTVLAFRPQLLVLDEPFGGLDPQVRDEFIRGMLEVAASDTPNTVIISSHDIAEVERLADWVGILIGGKLAVAEPMTELMGRFRRWEVVATGSASRVPDRWPLGWRRVERPAETVVQIIHQASANPDAAEAELRSIFGPAEITAHRLTLREIFLAHSQGIPAREERIAV